jgi:hypothetical protein
MPGVLANVANGSPTLNSKSTQDGSIILTMATFTPYLNSTFHIHTGSSTVVDATLISVLDLKAAAANPALIAGAENFSLLFAASSQSPLLADSAYTIEHDALGTFTLFLVPVEKAVMRRYEAIINRL